MKISYKWLSEYLPKNSGIQIPSTPQKLGEILTSVGLEVEGLEKFEEIPNGLQGMVTGQVISCEKHPNADRLHITTVDVGADTPLQIVCGAPNIARSQKVIVATPGSTLYPINGEAFTIKKTTIRGVESAGMICSEAEIGTGNASDGITVLEDKIPVGMPAAQYYNLYEDDVFEIGLTPNRSDAMSHMGVAKDVIAYLSHHQKKEAKIASPFVNKFKADSNAAGFEVEVENPEECPRYAGTVISNIKVGPSPDWIQNKLKSIGLKPVNNVVDITNFVLHETGQPLHAFDADKIKDHKIIVKTLPENTPFISLDGKERKLSAEDIMINDGQGDPMCIAGVFGGLESGVSEGTTKIFLESAVFNPVSIRKTLLRHNLRTDASIRFEKGVDISKTVDVLKRAALLIKETCGGEITSDIIDIYPLKKQKTLISLPNHYLKKISGKNYHSDTVKNILSSLNFEIIKEGYDDIQVEVPFSNPDITMPADVIEEIMRIDGLDNIEIPEVIQMAPAIDPGIHEALKKEKVMSWLNGNGFFEIFTNSITNSKYFNQEILSKSVRLLNSLSEDLDVLRPTMLPTGLECLAYNINRKNNNLLFAEFGNTYSQKNGHYIQSQNLALYFTGVQRKHNWNSTGKPLDIYYVKGINDAIFRLTGGEKPSYTEGEHNLMDEFVFIEKQGKRIAEAGKVSKSELAKFSIKQPVYFLNIKWNQLLQLSAGKKLLYEPVPKFPQVHRDLSLLVAKGTPYQQIEVAVKKLNIKKLVSIQLFDVYEGEKLGANKKSFAVSFVFSDREKTLTDKEVESMMEKIITVLETSLDAEIRRNA